MGKYRSSEHKHCATVSVHLITQQVRGHAGRKDDSLFRQDSGKEGDVIIEVMYITCNLKLMDGFCSGIFHLIFFTVIYQVIETWENKIR